MKLDFLKKYDFFVGVPDSQLKVLCNYLIEKYGIGNNHIIAANEGNACAIAAGYYMATKRIPVVYMQNSGEGNVVNPIVSLLNEKVYGIPCVFVIGWRGEPGVHDEPQHIFQGEITLKLLDVVGIEYCIIDKNSSLDEINKIQKKFDDILLSGKQVAYIVKKDAFEDIAKVEYKNNYYINREEYIKTIVMNTGDDIIVSTTGKTSRELFEVREQLNMTHDHDFLTVGSMGHASSIALGIAVNVPNKKILILDGDGALLMHMGSMAIIGSNSPKNLIHILINNESHESVGGMPTVSSKLNYKLIAEGCGYKNIYTVDDIRTLEQVLDNVKNQNELSFIEIKCAIGSRKDLGRPTISPKNNIKNFIDNI